jgi:hypothetical protein
VAKERSGPADHEGKWRVPFAATYGAAALGELRSGGDQAVSAGAGRWRVELTVADSVEEYIPLSRGEHEHRAGAVLGVADDDAVVG